MISQQQAVQIAEGKVTPPYAPKAVLALVTISDYLVPPAGFPLGGLGSMPNTGSNATGFVKLYDQKPEWVVEFPGVAAPMSGSLSAPG